MAAPTPGRDQAGHEGGGLEKANGVRGERGDAPRGCAMEIPAAGAQPEVLVPNLCQGGRAAGAGIRNATMTGRQEETSQRGNVGLRPSCFATFGRV